MTQEQHAEHADGNENSPVMRDQERTPTSRSVESAPSSVDAPTAPLDSGFWSLNSRLPIRWRLTIWYTGSLCLLLLGFSLLVWTTTSVWLVQQRDAELSEETAELQKSVESSSDEAVLRRNVDGWSQLHELYGFEYEIRRPDGSLLLQSSRLAQLSTSLHEGGTIAAGTVLRRDIRELGSFRVKTVSSEAFGQPVQLWIGVSQSEQQRMLDQLTIVLLTAGVVVLTGAGGGGYFLSRRALQPVEEITATAALISSHHLSERINVENPHDELGRLAQTLNTMLDRLDQSFGDLKRFTADAAHELRTPLTVLRSELEVCLRKPRSTEDYEQTLRSTLDNTQRVCRLAEQLLELARGDSGEQPVATDPVPLAALLTDVVSQLEPLAGPKGVTIELDDSLTCEESEEGVVEAPLVNGVAISGDCSRLRQLFFNLLDNAVKHTPFGGHVRIHAETSDTTVRVTIDDSGCGITSKHLPHIFDRFYRVDVSRTSTTGGAGLGLAICRSIVEAHGGTIDITSEPGKGTRVAVSLPVYGARPETREKMNDDRFT